MAQAHEIRDGESLEEWLKGRPAEDGIAISHRTALRVFPLYITGMAESRRGKLDMIAAGILPSLLISGVACKYLTPEIKGIAARSAQRAATSCDADFSSVAFSAAEAFAAAAAIAAGDAIAPNLTGYAKASAAGGAASGAVSSTIGDDFSVIWRQMRYDAELACAGKDMLSHPLWHVSRPTWFVDSYKKAVELWRNEGGEGAQFLPRWYQSILDGKPQDWDLLREIALIPEEVWAAGVDAVAQAIDTIIASGLSPDKGETIDPDPIPTQRQHLQCNARAITLQLGALQSFVTEEIEQLRGQNSLSSRERGRLDERIAKLKLILDSVALMIEAFEGELGEGSLALTVVEAQLPVVVGAADEAVKLGGAPEMSAVVVSMAATTKYLTEAGVPGSLAARFAFTEMCWGKVKGLLKPR